MKIPIGAYCDIEWNDTPGKFQLVFISFAEDCGDKDYDAFGTQDTKIFFFCPNGENELKNLMNKKNGEDFVVRDYSIVHGISDNDVLSNNIKPTKVRVK